MSTKIDRLWPKVAMQRGGQFCKWGISKPPTGQFLFLLGWRLEPQTAQWGVWSVQVGSSVVRIPNYVRNFWIWILAGVVTFLIFCSKIPFISVSYWRRWAPAGSKNKQTAHFSSKIRPDRLRGGKRNKKKEARVIFSGGFLEPPTTNRPQGCE